MTRFKKQNKFKNYYFERNCAKPNYNKMSSNTVDAPYTIHVGYPKAAEKLPSAPAAMAHQRKQSAAQSYKKWSARAKAVKGPAKAPSGKETDCSSALHSLDVTSSNFASTLRGNYISALDKKYKTGRPTPKVG